jgi:hypothetical protein
MRDENMLQSIHALDFRSFWVDKIHQVIVWQICEGRLVFRTKQALQKYSPITVPRLPPIEINVETCLDGWSGTTGTLDIGQRNHLRFLRIIEAVM